MPAKQVKTKELDNHLTLHGWLNHLFRYKTTRALLNDVKNIDEGLNPDGRSAVCEFLMSCAEPESEIWKALPVYETSNALI